MEVVQKYGDDNGAGYIRDIGFIVALCKGSGISDNLTDTSIIFIRSGTILSIHSLRSWVRIESSWQYLFADLNIIFLTPSYVVCNFKVKENCHNSNNTILHTLYSGRLMFWQQRLPYTWSKLCPLLWYCSPNLAQSKHHSSSSWLTMVVGVTRHGQVVWVKYMAQCAAGRLVWH